MKFRFSQLSLQHRSFYCDGGKGGSGGRPGGNPCTRSADLR